jgi:hypothetical protein
MPRTRGSFNLIRYTRGGRLDVLRRITLRTAIQKAEEHSRLDDFNMAAIRRVPDGKYIGVALRGQFRFE